MRESKMTLELKSVKNEKEKIKKEIRESRRKRIVLRLRELLKRISPGDAVRQIADEECLAPVTVYSILNGWR